MAFTHTFEAAGTKTTMRTANPFVALANAVSSFIDHQRAHRQLARLSRLPAHVVRDMGFDPDKIAAELEGSWDDVGLVRPSRH